MLHSWNSPQSQIQIWTTSARLAVARAVRSLQGDDLTAAGGALAFAVGTAVSLIPVPVLDTMVAAVVLRRAGRLPRGPFLLAMAVWNSFVMAPVYAAGPKVGDVVLLRLSLETAAHTLPLLVRLLVGNAVVLPALVVGSYCVALVALTVLLRRASAS